MLPSGNWSNTSTYTVDTADCTAVRAGIVPCKVKRRFKVVVATRVVVLVVPSAASNAGVDGVGEALLSTWKL